MEITVVHHFLCVSVVHDSLVLMMCHFFWSPLTLQDTSYSPEPHISADRSQTLLSAQEAVSLWVLGTRKVCISAEPPRDAILTHCYLSICVILVHIPDAQAIFILLPLFPFSLFLPFTDSFARQCAYLYHLKNTVYVQNVCISVHLIN